MESPKVEQPMSEASVRKMLGLKLLQAKYQAAETESQIALQRLLDVISDPTNFCEPEKEYEHRFEIYHKAQLRAASKSMLVQQVRGSLTAAAAGESQASAPVKETPTSK